MAASIGELLESRLSALYGRPISRDRGARWNVLCGQHVIHLTLEFSASKVWTIWVFDPRESGPTSAMDFRVRDLGEVDEVMARIGAHVKP